MPSEIFYDKTAPDGFRWGFDIKPEQKRHQWFKLCVLHIQSLGPLRETPHTDSNVQPDSLLDPTQILATQTSNLAKNYPSRTELPPDYAGEPTTYVTDYLTAIRKHTTETLNRRYGRSKQPQFSSLNIQANMYPR